MTTKQSGLRLRWAIFLPHVGFAGFILLLATVSQAMGVGSFLVSTMSNIAIMAIALMGLVILFGWSGQISIGHAAFVGLGAYTTALVHEHSKAFQVAWLYDLLAVVIVSLLAGFLVGLPALRITGMQLVVVTLGLAELFTWVMNTFPSLSGGSQGRYVGYVEIAGLSFASPMDRLLITISVATILAIGVTCIRDRRISQAMFIVRDSPLAATSIGVDPRLPRLLAFMASAVFAGIAGWLMAYSNLVVVPGSYSLFQSVYFLAAVMVGGRSTIGGAWVGAAFLAILPELSRSVMDGRLYPLFVGSALVLIALTIPRGIAPSVTTLFRTRKQS